MNKQEARELLHREFYKLKGRGELEEFSEEFASYCTMVGFCYDDSHPLYPEHGAKGETVKEEWLTGFDAFLAETGVTPSHRHEMELDAKVLAEADRLLSVDGLNEAYLRSKIEEIQDDIKNGRTPTEDDAVKFTAVMLSAWYFERSHIDESITLVGALKRFKAGERAGKEKVS